MRVCRVFERPSVFPVSSEGHTLMKLDGGRPTIEIALRQRVGSELFGKQSRYNRFFFAGTIVFVLEMKTFFRDFVSPEV